MRRFALIINDTVQHIVEADSIADRFHPDLEFIDVTGQMISEGQFFDRTVGVFRAPRPAPWFNWSAKIDNWVDTRPLTAIQADYTAAVQARLDAFAQSRGYDSGALCASYKGDPVEKWNNEATQYIAKRSQTWTKFYSVQDDITAGKRPMPTLDELLLELPVLTWDSNA